MEQKRQKALDMIERMKLQASENVQMGSELYIMHAKCAVEFADLLTELLTTEATSAPIAEPSPDAPIRVTVEYDGKKELIETKAAFLSFIDKEDGDPTVNYVIRNGTGVDEFLIYASIIQYAEKLADGKDSKKVYEQGVKEGMFQKEVDLMAQTDEASKGGADHD